MRISSIIWYGVMGVIAYFTIDGLVWGLSQPSPKERLNNEILAYKENIEECYQRQNKTFSSPVKLIRPDVPGLKALRAAYHDELVSCYRAQFQQK